VFQPTAEAVPPRRTSLVRKMVPASLIAEVLLAFVQVFRLLLGVLT
jgi:hypothetical protein